jgi:trk system potassium uptake protein TrkH
MKTKIKKTMSYPRLIVFYILCTVAVGTFLLMLPIATRSGQSAGFETALFTATSASCVTGLVLKDTYTYWSLFGQIVIITLIQVGGLGFMSFITLVSHALGKSIGLRNRKLIMESSGSLELDGILKLLKKIVLGTLLIEMSGAVLLSFRFCRDFGIGKGLYFALFHSISAFCNAGFDLMGVNEQFSSLTEYVDDPLVNVTVMLLILIGGLGFIVWDDIIKNRLNFKRYRLHTKLVLTATVILVVVPAILFYILEYNHSLKDLSFSGKIWASVFQAVTPRTAGFSTVNNTEFSDASVLMTVCLMLIGGNSGSTAGGMKTTTVIVLLLSMIASSKKNDSINVFRRRIDASVAHQASSIAFIYGTVTVIGTCIICAVDGLSLSAALFEISSAVGTVGSSMSMTPALSSFSHYMITLLMFCGRAGGLTLALVLAERKKNISAVNPAEKILIG